MRFTMSSPATSATMGFDEEHALEAMRVEPLHLIDDADVSRARAAKDGALEILLQARAAMAPEMRRGKLGIDREIGRGRPLHRSPSKMSQSARARRSLFRP